MVVRRIEQDKEHILNVAFGSIDFSYCIDLMYWLMKSVLS